jgi:hypothetical protein
VRTFFSFSRALAPLAPARDGAPPLERLRAPPRSET